MTRATKNIDLEVVRFAEFCRDILIPVFADVVSASSGYLPPIEITSRHIRDAYGLSTSNAFNLMFQKLSKGNQTRSGTGYKSRWLPNLKAIGFYQQWNNTTTEKTGRSLYQFLCDNGCEPVEWNSALGCWLTADLAQRLREAKAQTEQEEADHGIDYAALRQSLIVQDQQRAST